MPNPVCPDDPSIVQDSKDYVKCRVAATLFPYFNGNHRPDWLSGSGWSFGSPCFRDLLFRIEPLD